MTLPNPIKYHFYHGQDLPEAWPYAYLVAREGVYKVASTCHFWAYTRLASCHVAGLRPFSGAPAAVQLHMPRIPAKWLTAVLHHARKCGGRGQSGRGAIYTPIEQMYHFHHLNGAGRPFGRSQGSWQVSVQAQKASAGRVSYWGGNEASVVLDLHSHHEMGAWFSSTDNGDELGCRLYAVIGCIYSRPEIRVRLGLYGSFAEIDPLTVFEGLGPFEGMSRRSPGEDG